MWIRSLRLVDAPGVDRLSLEELHPGVNVIWGPNASGKSTVARALRSLFSTTPGGPARVQAILEEGKGRHEVIRPHDGAPIWPSELAHPARGYDPELHALDLSILSQSNDEALAARFAEELFGGVDLEAARSALKVPASARSREPARVADAQQSLRRARNAAGELASDEARLEGLRRSRDQAARASSDLSLVQGLLTHLELRQQLAELQRQRESIEAGVECVPASAAATLTTLRSDRDEAGEAMDQSQAEVVRLRDEESRAAFEGESPRLETIEARRTEAEAQKTRADELARGRLALAEAQGAEEEMGRALFAPASTATPAGPLGEEDAERLHRALTDLARAIAERDGARQSATEVEQWLSESLEVARQKQLPEDITDLRQGSDALRDWLILTPEQHPRWRTFATFVAFLGGIGFGGLLYTLAFGLRFPTFLGVLGGLAALGVVGRLLAGRVTRPRDDPRRATLQEVATRAGVVPEHWNRESVATRLTDTWEVLAGRAALGRGLDEARGIHRRLDEAAERIQGEAAEAFAHLGLSPELPELGAHERTERIIKLVRAKEEVARHSKTVTTLGADLELEQQALIAWLEGLGVEVPGTPEGLVRCLEEVQKRSDRLEDLRGQRQEAERRLERDDEAHSRREAALAEAWKSWGLEPADEGTLHRLAEARPEFDRLEDELRLATDALSRGQASLQDEELARLGLDPRTTSRDEAEARKAKLELEQASLLDRSDEIARIENAVRTAGTALAMQDARAELHAAHSALEQARDDALGRAMADLFLVDARDGFVAEHQPDRLERACQLFADFTDHQWQLIVDPVAGAFTALDTSRRLRRGLGELSSGTRVHLLLAARLAAIESREKGGPTLPLCLDELLSTTDPGRFDEVADTLFDLAEEGRQIFYFTAQPEELQRWQAAARRRAGEESDALLAARPILEGLEAGAWGEEHSIVPDSVDHDAVLAPPPGGDADAYALLLRVHGPDGHRVPEAWHLLHLLPDHLEAVHTLLRRGVKTLGIWRSAWGDPLAPERAPFLAPEVSLLIDLRGRLLEETLAAWGHGRGRPLCWSDVMGSGAVSDTFLARVRTVFDDRGGDTATFLAELEAVKGFRRAKQEQLTEHLRELGVISDVPPRDDETILAVVLSRSSGLLEPGSDREAEARAFVENLLSLLSPARSSGSEQVSLKLVEGGGDA